jgi:hypothetical protein
MAHRSVAGDALGEATTQLVAPKYRVWRKVAVLIAGAVLIAAALLGVAPGAFATNEKPVQTYYVPYQEDQLLTAFQAIANNTNPTSPVMSYVTISALANSTIIYYDQWENGYDPDIANRINIYSASNPGGTQIWGDGNQANGYPPGDTSDTINAGTVINLSN